MSGPHPPAFDDDSWTEATDIEIDRLDLVAEAANGTRFLIRKAASGRHDQAEEARRMTIAKAKKPAADQLAVFDQTGKLIGTVSPDALQPVSTTVPGQEPAQARPADQGAAGRPTDEELAANEDDQAAQSVTDAVAKALAGLPPRTDGEALRKSRAALRLGPAFDELVKRCPPTGSATSGAPSTGPACGCSWSASRTGRRPTSPSARRCGRPCATACSDVPNLGPDFDLSVRLKAIEDQLRGQQANPIGQAFSTSQADGTLGWTVQMEPTTGTTFMAFFQGPDTGFQPRESTIPPCSTWARSTRAAGTSTAACSSPVPTACTTSPRSPPLDRRSGTRPATRSSAPTRRPARD